MTDDTLTKEFPVVTISRAGLIEAAKDTQIQNLVEVTAAIRELTDEQMTQIAYQLTQKYYDKYDYWYDLKYTLGLANILVEEKT